jgi:hypothetical protein
MKKSKSYRSQLFKRRIVALLLMVIVGSGGYALTHLSSAATGYNHNAIGFINSCGLDPFSRTVIYGWAYDADTGNNAFPKAQVNVGGTVIVAYTDVPAYNEGKINDYLRTNRPNTPITGTYGFKAVFGQLTKGSTYAVSGVALNEGSGGSTTLNMDSVADNQDGITGGTLLTANWTLPDACLGLTPVTPPPPPPPLPPPTSKKIQVCDLTTKQIVYIYESEYDSTRYSKDLSKCATPPVIPPPTGGGGGGTGGTTGTPKSNPVVAAAQEENQGKADGSVSAGTLSATISVPGDGAKSFYLLYGSSADNLDSSTEDLPVSDDKTELILTDLQPKSKYYYQIIRTDSAGKVTSSPPATFDTAGYAIAVHFQDGKNKAVGDIKAVLDDADRSDGKSDKNGDLKFYDLTPGTYTVTFEYKKLTYTREFDTESASTDDASSGKVIVLKDTVNVSTLKNGSTEPLPTKKHSVLKIVFWLLFILAIGGAIVWLVLRRRRMKLEARYGGYAAPAGLGVIDMPTSEAQQLMPPPAQIAPTGSAATAAKKSPAITPTGANGEPLEHVGESLREMVIRSMHDEAQKRKDGSSGDKNNQ